MKRNSISVVMACYHGDNLTSLKEAVNSVMSQTLAFLEFIIVLDGPVSVDIDQYLDELEEANELVKIFRIKENSGAAKARNLGMSHSQGKYIAIMDSDDILLPERLEAQLDALNDKCVDAVWGWQEEFYDGTNEYAGVKRCPEEHGAILKKLKYRNLLPDPTTFIKRECFEKTKGYAEFDNIGMDYKFFLEIALHGYRLHCVQKPLIRVRISPVQRKRRGGWVLLKQDYSLRQWMYKKKIINIFEMSWIMLMYAVFRLQPNILRDKLYKHVLRKE